MGAESLGKARIARIGRLVGLMILSGCSGDILGGGGTGAPPDSGPDATAPGLAFTAPASGESFTRAFLDDTGQLVAEVGVSVAVAGPIARVELSDDAGDPLGELGADGAAEALFATDGARTITATGFDAAGAAVATAAVDITVVAPAASDCHQWLDVYGVVWAPGPNNQGVADPITVTPPINGLPYRYVTNSGPRTSFFMDCGLALSLVKAAPILRQRGVVEVADIGVYNYRCIGEGTPPNCPSGMSQHAHANAIDLAGFTLDDGSYYSVTDDWVIDPADEATCAAATEPGPDTWMHDTICALKGAGVWNIVLTPNYNADHRSHFHVDLTPGADYIRARSLVDHGPNDW
jgi:hypothetical protein